MPIFDFKAVSAAGKNVRSVVEAESQKAARIKLKKQGLMVVDIQEKTVARPSSSAQMPFIGGKVGVRDLALVTRQLASLIKANIPLVDALTALVDQTEKETLKVVLSQVRQEVNEGIGLAKALGKHPKVFDNIFINMVEAGESSGTLGLVLLRLADLKEAQMRLRNKVTTAMMYPILMMVVAAFIMIAIFAFVIPKLAKVFETSNKPMPVITQVLIQISAIVVDYWYLLLAIAIGVTMMFRSFITSKAGRPKWDAFKLKFPVLGPLIRVIAVTRFASTMATLLGAGVPILTAMNIAKNLVGNIPIAKAIANARDNITEGQSIAEPLRRSGEFPPMVIHMISIGEKTGELPSMLQNVADTYEDQVNARVEGMTALIEPLMIIGMGGVVGFIVMAIFVPLMEIGDIS